MEGITEVLLKCKLIYLVKKKSLLRIWSQQEKQIDKVNQQYCTHVVSIHVALLALPVQTVKSIRVGKRF
jgi:uncharacterized membrane protein